MKTVLATDNTDPRLNMHLWQWASLKIFGHLKGFGPCACMGVFDGEELIASMVYHNADRAAGVIEISGAASDRRWLKRAVLREMFSIPFDRFNCQTVAMRVSPKEEQKHVHRMLHAYGFESYILPRLRGRDEDEMVFLLHDNAWAENRFNRRDRNHGETKQVAWADSGHGTGPGRRSELQSA